MKLTSYNNSLDSKNVFFRSDKNSSIPSSKLITTNNDTNSNKDKLYYGLGLLSLAVIGGISYKKIRSIKMVKKSDSEHLNNIVISTFSLKNIIENFSKKLSNNELSKFHTEFKRLEVPKYDLFNSLKNIDPKNFVKYILAAKKCGLTNLVELPKVLALGNVSSKTKDVSKIFAAGLDSSFKSTKYTKGHMAEFIESLDGFSASSFKKYNEEQVHTFLHLDNASEFLTDLKLKENEQLNAKLNKIFTKIQENKIIYIIDDNAANQLNTDSILKLDFDERINTADLTKDLEEVEFQLGSKLIAKTNNISEELSEYLQPNDSPIFYTIRNLLLDNPTEKAFIVNSQDKSVIEKTIRLISSRTNNAFEKLDYNGVSDLSSFLAKSGEKSEELYQRTGKRTFLYLDNLEQSQQINDFIAIASEKYHIIPVLNSQNNEIISKINLPENQVFKMDFWDKGQKSMVDSMELMKEKMKKNDFSHIDLERLKREFFNLIAAERSGMNPKIGNGILLHGSDNLTKITAEAIKNTVDANYAKLNYDKNDPEKLIIDLVEEAEKAEEVFKQTRKRTIIEAEGLDNILTLNIKVPEDRDLINEFKSIAEDLSERYHTTLIMRTDKSIEPEVTKFEKASIASNRLGMHIEVK